MESPHQNLDQPDVLRRLASIRERFPDRFSNEQIEEIRIRIGRSIEMGQKLREHDLPNGVGPVFDPRALSR